jgi:hypothetical protein
VKTRKDRQTNWKRCGWILVVCGGPEKGPSPSPLRAFAICKHTFPSWFSLGMQHLHCTFNYAPYWAVSCLGRPELSVQCVVQVLRVYREELHCTLHSEELLSPIMKKLFESYGRI